MEALSETLCRHVAHFPITAGRIPLFDLTPPQLAPPLELPAKAETLLIEDSRVALSTEAAATLNSMVGAAAFTPSSDAGIACDYAGF